MDENKALAGDMDNFSEEMSYRGAPYQQLVTDRDGKAQWKDQLAYSELTDATIMEKQIVHFADDGRFGYGAMIPDALDIKSGDKLTVIWDGTSYDVIVSEEFIESKNIILLSFGNFDLMGYGEISDYPFFCQIFRYIDDGQGSTMWMANDIAESHTIKVIRQSITYTKIDGNFMPEGYPSKNSMAVVLQSKYRADFMDKGDGYMVGNFGSYFTLIVGEKLTILWDGINYDVIVKELDSNTIGFGNFAIVGRGEATEYPFVFINTLESARWATLDRAATHNIKVTRQEVTYTPIDQNFISTPKIVFTQEDSSFSSIHCDVAYDQIRKWIKNDLPIIALYKKGGQAGRRLITLYEIYEDNITFFTNSNRTGGFMYHSDGTFEGVGDP